MIVQHRHPLKNVSLSLSDNNFEDYYLDKVKLVLAQPVGVKMNDDCGVHDDYGNIYFDDDALPVGDHDDNDGNIYFDDDLHDADDYRCDQYDDDDDGDALPVGDVSHGGEVAFTGLALALEQEIAIKI